MKIKLSCLFALVMLLAFSSQVFADEYVNGTILNDYDNPPEKLLDEHSNDLDYSIKYTLSGSTKTTTTANVSINAGFKDAFKLTVGVTWAREETLSKSIEVIIPAHSSLVLYSMAICDIYGGTWYYNSFWGGSKEVNVTTYRPTGAHSTRTTPYRS